MDKAWTLLELLNTTRLFLTEKCVENPRGNVEAFFMKALNLPRIELYLQHDRPITETEVQQIRSFVRRRLKYEPLQLIVGTAEFCGANLDLLPGTLIPRPETEEMAFRAFEEIRNLDHKKSLRMLDIGCGTGCLAIALAVHEKTAVVDAIDIDPIAVQCTHRNTERNGVTTRVNVISADLFSPSFVEQVNPPYDLIISNPPYVTETEYQDLAPELREYEPRHALVAADNGLAFYKRIASLLPALLKPEGLFIWEFGFKQAESMHKIFGDLFIKVEWYDDLAGITRFAVASNKHPELPLTYQISGFEDHAR